MPAMPKTTRPMTAVLYFQLEGCAYQPPAGDQTCLGKLHRRWLVSDELERIGGCGGRILDFAAATHFDRN